MTIEMIENNELKTMNVEDLGDRKNYFLFLQILNYFDDFVHETPVWANSIVQAVRMRQLAEFANSSAATA